MPFHNIFLETSQFLVYDIFYQPLFAGVLAKKLLHGPEAARDIPAAG
jgi:hypothetical protein